MKAISAIIVVVLLLLISISLISVVYVWSSALTGTVTSTTEETTSELTKQLSGCLKIDAISKNQIYLRNCGKGVITNNSLSVFIDDVKVGHSVEEIGEDQTGTVNISGLWKFSMDRHNLKLTNGAAFVQALIELEPNKDGLVGYWSFDEGSGNKVYDKSGNGNDGSLLPSGSGPIWTAGKFGSALQFDGTDDYVEVSNPGSINGISKVLTVSVWIKPTSGNQGNHIIDDINGAFGNGGWLFRLNGVAFPYGLSLEYWQNGASSYTGAVTASNVLLNNEWYYLTGVININQNYIKIYVNGEEKASNTASGQIGPHNDPFRISYPDWGVSGTYFNGLIDEVRIYNKALTPDQTVVMKMI